MDRSIEKAGLEDLEVWPEKAAECLEVGLALGQFVAGVVVLQ